MPEERKLVTVLFADIVGSTALTTSNQPEVVRDVMSRTFTRMSEVVLQHGGTVEKFSGDEVMAVFGAPTAHDDDADRAVRTAFALRETVSGLPSGALRLRIGLNTGEVVATSEIRDQQLVTGEPVIAAARLRASAEPNEIVVGALTRRLTELDVRYGRKRHVKAKGLGTIEASTAEALVSPIPLQQRGLARLRAPMIGRDKDLRLIVDAQRRVGLERSPRLVTVIGSAGAGKSRLAHEFVEMIGADSVLRGRCLPYGEGITFWALQEMLRSAAGIVGDDARDEANRKLNSAVVSVFGGPSDDGDATVRRLAVLLGTRSPDEALPGIAANTVRDEMRWALGRFFDRRAGNAPLTLIFEDIHWAEATLLDIIEDLVHGSRAPICVLCLARPDLLVTRPSWGQKVSGTRVLLEPLSTDETRRLINELLRIEDLPEHLRTALVARAEGNPLYVEEFLRMLIDTGRIERRGRRWIAAVDLSDLGVPPTIQGLIAARLDRLDEPVKQALQAAAAIGRDFWTDALVGLGQPADDLDRRLARAEERDLVLEIDERGLAGGKGYRFKHVLVRDVTYGGIHKGERLRLHDGFATWLEEAVGTRGPEYIDVIAHHSEQAFILARELGDPEVDSFGRRALGHLRAAIARARFHVDRPAVVALCDRALVVATSAGVDEADRAEVAAIAALTRFFIDHAASSLAALEASIGPLRRCGPSGLLVRALTTVAMGYVWGHHADRIRAQELFEDALARARELGDPEYIVEAMVQRTDLAAAIADEDERLRILTDAYNYVKANSVRSVMHSPVPRLVDIAAFRGNFTEAAALRAEHSALAKATGSRWSHRWTLGGQLTEALQLGDDARAASLGAELLGLERERGGQREIAEVTIQIGDALHGLGDFVGARASHAKALELDAPLMDRAGREPEILWRLARDALSLGHIDEAEAFAQQACEIVLVDDVYSQASTRLQLAKVRAAQGRDDDAEALFRDGLRILDGTRYDRNAADARRDYAEFLIARARLGEARSLLQRAREFYKDPLAFRKRERIDALLERTVAVIS